MEVVHASSQARHDRNASHSDAQIVARGSHYRIAEAAEDAEAAAPLDATLRRLLFQVSITDDDLAMLRWCLVELRQIVFQIHPAWQVKPFGSAVNGFGSRGWDLDATCFFEPDAQIDKGVITDDLRQRLPQMLTEHPRFSIIEFVSSARIPLLKMRFNQVLDVDLSFHNTEPVANTHLLRAYAHIHWCIREVAVLVKLWAKSEGVCGAKNGHLSAYALTMMCIYFMQVDSRVQLPCLDTSLFDGIQEPPKPMETWKCGTPLLDLLTWFFEFYSATFWWGEEVVSVRLGQRHDVSDKQFSTLRGRSPYPTLHIEDPFLLQRNLNCVLGQEQEQLLYGKICEAYRTLNEGTLPEGLQTAVEQWGADQDSAASQNDDDEDVHTDAPSESSSNKSIDSSWQHTSSQGQRHSSHNGLLVTSSQSPQVGEPMKLMLQPQLEPLPDDPQLQQRLKQRLKQQQQRQRRRRRQRQRPKQQQQEQEMQELEDMEEMEEMEDMQDMQEMQLSHHQHQHHLQQMHWQWMQMGWWPGYAGNPHYMDDWQHSSSQHSMLQMGGHPPPLQGPQPLPLQGAVYTGAFPNGSAQRTSSHGSDAKALMTKPKANKPRVISLPARPKVKPKPKPKPKEKKKGVDILLGTIVNQNTGGPAAGGEARPIQRPEAPAADNIPVSKFFTQSRGADHMVLQL